VKDASGDQNSGFSLPLLRRAVNERSELTDEGYVLKLNRSLKNAFLHLYLGEGRH